MDKVDIPQGTLELMILTILSRESLHGYGISQKLAALTHDVFQVNPGSLFPSLYRLEQDDLVTRAWEIQEAGPARVVYTITEAGIAYLQRFGMPKF